MALGSHTETAVAEPVEVSCFFSLTTLVFYSKNKTYQNSKLHCLSLRKTSFED